MLLVSSLLLFLSSAEKAYPLGVSFQNPLYYDYENSSLPGVCDKKNSSIIDDSIKSYNDYLLTTKIGAGKFSDVFEAVEIYLGTFVVLKCLKPATEKKIKCELLILKNISELTNVCKIKAIVLPAGNECKNPTIDSNKFTEIENNSKKLFKKISSMPTLVLERAHGDWFCHPIKQRKRRTQNVSKEHSLKNNNSNNRIHSDLSVTSMTETKRYLTEYEIRYYLLHLLTALDRLHSCGIMHRDMKPRNVLIDRRWTLSNTDIKSLESCLPLSLIDMGLADFYRFGSKYNVRVASRHYKSPELLLGPAFGFYNYSVDLWGVGCILAGLLFRKEPFFRGNNNLDQLNKIIQVLGTNDLVQIVAKSRRYEMLPDDVRQLINYFRSRKIRIRRQPWTEFLSRKSIGSSSYDRLSPDRNASHCVKSLRIEIQQRRIMNEFQLLGMDLLDKLLVYDSEERLTARQAIQHEFFDPVRSDVMAIRKIVDAAI